MANDSLIPQPKKSSLARRGIKALLPEAGWDAITTAFRLVGGAGVLTGVIATLTHFLASASLNVKLIIGVFLSSFVFLIIAFVSGRVQRRVQQRETHMVPSQQADAPAESVRIVREPCPDSWVHEIVNDSRSVIWQYVRIEKCALSGHSLVDATPYIDFAFKLFNASVFRLAIDETIQGSVKLNDKEFGAEVKTRVGVANWTHNSEALLIIRQWLNPGEAALVLNNMGDEDVLRFSQVQFTVRGQNPASKVVPSRPSLLHQKIPCSELRPHYPKLQIDIRQVMVASLMDVPEGNYWDMTSVGTVLTLEVFFRSQRAHPIQARQFRAMVKAGEKTYAANARTGDLHTKIQKVKGEIVPSVSGEKIKNLNPGVFPLEIERDQDFYGWLQFVFEGPTPDTLESGGRLAIIDLTGEEHARDFLAIYGP